MMQTNSKKLLCLSKQVAGRCRVDHHRDETWCEHINPCSERSLPKAPLDYFFRFR
jgi:hypothetical protein